MSRLKTLPLALAAFALVASLADAQATSWNRRISDVHIVHPPGTPPGTWRIAADVEVSANGTLPGTLSFDCALYLDGTLITVVHVPVEPSAGPNICPGSCSGGCQIAVSFGVPLAGTCSATGGCHCSMNLSVDVGTLGASYNSTALVVVTPGGGSIPETDTSDDFMSRTIPQNNPGSVTCAGDGTHPVACPCANNGASGHGCANSANTSGAHLTATGFVEVSPSGGTDSVVMHVTDMPAGAPLLYFQGTSNMVVIPFGDGMLCTTGSLIRLRVKINVGGASTFPEPGEPSVSTAGGVPLSSGATYYYQAYHRDSATYCTSSTFNLSNGISLTWY